MSLADKCPDLDRVVGIGPRKIGDRPVEGRREEHRLPHFGDAGDDPINLGPEAHVEHPVGLVEDQHTNVAERHGAAIDQVDQAARRGYQDLGAARFPRLSGHRRSTVDGFDAQLEYSRDRGELGNDLDGKLTRRHEHEGARMAAHSRGALEERNTESERLARPGRRPCEQVEPGQSIGDYERLDRQRRLDTATCEDADDLGTNSSNSND